MSANNSQVHRSGSHPWVPVGITQLIDDLLWTFSCLVESHVSSERYEKLKEMLAEYTNKTEFYSDGSDVGSEYLPDGSNVNRYMAFEPPHRRCTCQERPKPRIQDREMREGWTHTDPAMRSVGDAGW